MRGSIFLRQRLPVRWLSAAVLSLLTACGAGTVTSGPPGEDAAAFIPGLDAAGPVAADAAGGPSDASVSPDASSPADGGPLADAGPAPDAGEPPVTPAGLSAAAGDGQVLLSWAASGGADGYRVKRATSSSGPFAEVGAPAVTSFTDTGVVNGTTYFYVVSATRSGLESPDSAPVSATPTAGITPPRCLAAEVCANQVDDDCAGGIDEAGCLTADSYLPDWRLTGQVVDYVLFGTYPLYQDLQAGRDVQRQTWGQQCVGQTGSATPEEESDYCLGGTSDFVEWTMTAPAEGYYVLMLSDIRSDSAHPLQVDRGAGLESLPPVAGAQRVALLRHGVGGYPSEIFYLLRLPAGPARLRVGGSSRFLFLTSAVLAFLKEKDHYYPNPVYPHVDFTQAQVDAIRAGPLSTEQQALLTGLATRANNALSVTTLAAEGRDRQGVLEDLSQSAILNADAAHLAKAIALFREQVRWLAANDGDYLSGDVLMYGYDLRQLGTCWDLLAPHFAAALGAADLADMREQLSVEMMRHALSNAAGNWWRLPRQGGWTSSHGQGGKLGLSLVHDDKLARFYFDLSLLMYKTSLRDNISEGGSYLQALGGYYGWDYWNLAYVASGLANNPGLTGEDLFAYDGSALHKYYHYLLYSLAPTKRCTGPFGSESCSGIFYASMVSTLQVAAARYQDGAIQWMHDELTKAGRAAPLIGDPLTESLRWRAETPAPVDPGTVLPLGKVTRGNEHVFMRTGWGQDDFAFMSRCGLAGNHNQREQGSFILYADGANYVQAYNEYTADSTVYTFSRDKNFVLIDDKGQTTFGMDTRLGSVTSFLHSAALDFANCDNSLAYSSDPSDADSQPVDYSNRRTVFVRPRGTSPGYFVMLDRIKAVGTATHRYEYQLHPGCRVQNGQSAGGCVDPIGVQTPGAPLYQLTRPGSNKRLALAVAEPEAASQASSTVAAPVGGFPAALRVRSSVDRAVGEFAVVLFPEDPDAGRTLPPFARISAGAGQVGFTLGPDLVLWSKDRSALAHAGVASDAAVVLVRDAASPSLLALLEGTSLSLGGTEHLKVSASSNAVMTLDGGARKITVGNDMAGSAIDVAIGGLTPSAGYACGVNGTSRGVLTADASGVVRVTSVGPAATTIELTPQ